MANNIGASITARLLNIAKKSNRTNEAILSQYFYERFLYRVGLSDYKDKLFLKGGLLLISYDRSDKMRPTKDLDFSIKNLAINRESVKKMIKEIMKIKDKNDSVYFKEETLQLKRIMEEADYEGWQVSFKGYIRGTRVENKLRIDIATGDVISPEPVEIKYPTLIENEEPLIMAYSIESVIAEKYETIIRRGIANSRMKDFYDIVHIAECEDFKHSVLKSAIEKTLENRETIQPENLDEFFDYLTESEGINERWFSFIKRMEKLDQEDFSKVIKRIKKFIIPIFKNKNCRSWNKEKRIWEEITD